METEQANLEYPYESAPPYGTTMELAPGVFWLQMPLPMSLNHINLYLLDDGDSWVVVDTGIHGEETQQYWQKIFAEHMQGKPVSRVICTHLHPDHTGQAGFIADYWQATLLMSYSEYYQARVMSSLLRESSNWHTTEYFVRAGIDQHFLEQMRKDRDLFTPDVTDKPLPASFIRLTDGDLLKIGGENWQIITGTGHSPEHVCLYSQKHRILISGDQILPIITSNVSVFPTEPEGNPMLGWMESLSRFREKVPNDTLVLPAHNAPFYGLHERVSALIAHHEDRMLAIEESCVEPHTAVDLLPVLFKRKLEGHSRFMALGECVAHLHCLMTHNRIERRLENGVYSYLSVDPGLEQRATPGHHDAPDDSPLLV
ncbi:MAG: MBL fold metallo-hydrolase [Gammaproteobacteria bacterium]|nr:MBL fold metallo-hydrolase [Gammaproteobacteria bacterium]